MGLYSPPPEWKKTTGHPVLTLKHHLRIWLVNWSALPLCIAWTMYVESQLKTLGVFFNEIIVNSTWKSRFKNLQIIYHLHEHLINEHHKNFRTEMLLLRLFLCCRLVISILAKDQILPRTTSRQYINCYVIFSYEILCVDIVT